ncbi:MAG: 2-hydroxyacyl-CoA dehydratase family protein, partial [Spirochaetota bacterium]
VYYIDAPTWMQNCWGINVVLNMDATMATNMINTTDPDLAMRDLALLTEKSTMRHHAVGGWDTVNKIWEFAEKFKCDMIIFYDQIGCKGMNGVHGLMEDEARKRNFHFMWVEHDLEDPRTISRRTIREQVNEYMFTVMNEKPLDETLIDFDDSLAW